MSDTSATQLQDDLAEASDGQMTVSELRDGLSTAINRVAFAQERITILRQGKAVAVLVPVEDLKLLDRIEDAYWTRKAEEVLEDYDPADGIPADEFWKSMGLD